MNKNYSNEINKESVVLKVIFFFLILFYDVNLLYYHFIFTYYITFYILMINIFLILKFKSVNSKKELYQKGYILISIIFMHLPLPAIMCLYRFNKKWMNKVIILFLYLLLLLIAAASYYSKIFFMLVLLILSLLVLCVLLYIGPEKANLIVKKNKLIISLVVSLTLYYLNNI